MCGVQTLHNILRKLLKPIAIDCLNQIKLFLNIRGLSNGQSGPGYNINTLLITSLNVRENFYFLLIISYA